MTQIGERIRNQRISKNITQSELANRLGLAVSTISMYENGERTPSDTVKVKIATVFETTVGALFFDEKDT
uniref:helix-turn-helix domain-containing protein n=1 Tax=Ndongobacter massiliensis TaxID=1871025 RepID=UPI000930734B|nr:helix-turn-helix transcriptional regulator [Ndongobacter massiliensis]